MGHGAQEAPRKATREEMRDANLPIQYRDSCAHLLIPLNRCRSATYYLPWKCEVRPAETATAGSEIVSKSPRHVSARAADTARYRTRGTATKSASTTSSSSGWPRWTSYGRPRAASGATDCAGSCWGSERMEASGARRWSLYIRSVRRRHWGAIHLTTLCAGKCATDTPPILGASRWFPGDVACVSGETGVVDSET
ncbi:hypothetical protein RB601_004344 [Gaeumannomyces tritici]